MWGCGGRRTLFLVRISCAALMALAITFAYTGNGRAETQSQNDSEMAPLTFGGPFALVDHTGRAVTDVDFRGSYLLVFFGYTHCPDICPTGLSTMAVAMDLLGEAAERVQPIFISVDPERDTAEVLADYVSLFHPRLVGLTGTPKQVHDAAKAYHVIYTITEYKGEILVGHTADTYLVGPDGAYIENFAHETAPEDIAVGIRRAMDENNLKKRQEATQ